VCARTQTRTHTGLYGTYFENTDFTDHGVQPNGSSAASQPSFTRLDKLIDMNWRASQRPCGMPNEIHKEIGPDYFSVRWQVVEKQNICSDLVV